MPDLPFAATIPTFPKPDDFSFWLEAEVEDKTAGLMQGLVDKGEARWIPDPEVRTVWALQYCGTEHDISDIGGKQNILLVLYDNGEDFETTEEWEALFVALGHLRYDP